MCRQGSDKSELLYRLVNESSVKEVVCCGLLKDEKLQKLGPGPFSMQGKARKEGTCGVPYAQFGKNPGCIYMYAQQLSDEFTLTLALRMMTQHIGIYRVCIYYVYIYFVYLLEM